MSAKVVGNATLDFNGQQFAMDVVEGSEKEQGVRIGKLRGSTGLITLDEGYVNTGSCESSITYIDGENGILRYRGYDIAELADNCSFLEVAYLLVNERLPTQSELDRFSVLMNEHAMIHENMLHFIHSYPEHAHPMAILSAMVVSLGSFYPDHDDPEEEMDMKVTRLLSKMRTLAALSYKTSIGEPYVYPQKKYKFCENFLHMMFDSPVTRREITDLEVKALNKLLILHADHEQNCSTSVVRMVGSSEANLYACIASGICALWGPLHGGANQKVMEMLARIKNEGMKISDVIEKAKDKNSDFRLMGFGHRVYKAYDPRARIAKESCQEVLSSLGKTDPLLDIAMELEQAALADDYFKERNLYPNVDYYTGITYRAMGIPTNMFTVMFSIGRLPGWIAQYLEQRHSPGARIGRPRQIYTGPTQRAIQPIAERG